MFCGVGHQKDYSRGSSIATALMCCRFFMLLRGTRDEFLVEEIAHETKETTRRSFINVCLRQAYAEHGA